MSVQLDDLLDPPELAMWLKRSPRYISYMKRRGFRMTGGRATPRQALQFLALCPNPCSKHAKEVTEEERKKTDGEDAVLLARIEVLNHKLDRMIKDMKKWSEKT